MQPHAITWGQVYLYGSYHQVSTGGFEAVFPWSGVFIYEII